MPYGATGPDYDLATGLAQLATTLTSIQRAKWGDAANPIGNLDLPFLKGSPADAIQLRALASARNSGETWDLRCEIREKLISYLQTAHPKALPHRRLHLSEGVGIAEAKSSTGGVTPG